MPLSNLTLSGGAERHIFAMPTSEPSPNRPKYPARPITLSSIRLHSLPAALYQSSQRANSTVRYRYRRNTVSSTPKGLASGKISDDKSLSR